ncbi:hypothetical protein IQ250_23600 [Pseudanabaenaceae cyanobacterium LEGE 13415]|nr:hypothetical protein [Pseudanabaenaceae cyanobacterium LEGE 13415]
MSSIIVWIAEFVGEVIVAAIAQFATEVFVGWIAEAAETMIAEWLTAFVSEVTQWFTELLSRR